MPNGTYERIKIFSDTLPLKGTKAMQGTMGMNRKGQKPLEGFSNVILSVKSEKLRREYEPISVSGEVSSPSG